MTDSPRADVVAQQYEKWTYPEPIQNLETWVADNWQWFDPSHAHRILWPDRPYRADLDILIAGCGTNQAALFAYTNPAAKVVAVDVSQPSLDHEKFLKDKYALKNLELRLLPIEEVPSLDQKFDLVISTGVLHHMADPKAGMKALGRGAAARRCRGDHAVRPLRPGRGGVDAGGVPRDGSAPGRGIPADGQGGDRLAGRRPSGEAATSSIAPDLQFDAGVVDTFLHGRDRSYTVDDCLELVEAGGLVFQDWFQKTPYYPPTLTEPGNEFYAAVNQLPTEKMWAVMERVKTLNGCHFFLATHPDRPKAELPDRLRGQQRPGLRAAVPAARRRQRPGDLPAGLEHPAGPDASGLHAARRRRALDPRDRRSGWPRAVCWPAPIRRNSSTSPWSCSRACGAATSSRSI